jgi:hypothetical protein
MGTEKTIMKDSKGSGGIVEITNQKSALVRWTLTFVDSRQQRILYFSGSMHACRNIHETRRVGLYIKGVSHGFIQMVYYCLDLLGITNQKSALVR